MRFRHVAIGISLLALLFTGCLMNNITTARPVGAGNVSLTGGLGVYNDETSATPNIFLEGRLDIGLTDRLDLGFRTGLVSANHWYPYHTGLGASIKYAFIDDPNSVTIAVGADMRWSLLYFEESFIGASLYIDSNLPFLPVYFSLHPVNYNNWTEENYFILCFAGGLHFDLNDTIRLLVGATATELWGHEWWNFGAGVQFIL